MEDELGHPGALLGFGSAMLLRVRLAGGEVPLWSLVAPLIVIGALAAALAAAAVSDAPSATEAERSTPAPSASALAARAPTPQPSAAPSARTDAAGAESAAAPPAEEETLNAQPGKYSVTDVLGFAARRAAREVELARRLRAALDRDPGLVEESRTLGELRRLSSAPETARIALEAMASLPAPVAPDLLYEVWTGAVQRSEVTELARALLFSKEVLPKASPSLAVVLDLRVSQDCATNKAILPRAEKVGDRRALPLLTQLQRKYGCGPNKRQDCNPCLRGGDALDAAIKAVKARREPRTFGSKR